MARGELRIYLGAAPGVGKTYDMLDEGRRRAARGTDVVIGVCDPKGRPRTAARAVGLESVPLRRWMSDGVPVAEMDLTGILRRRPAVVLVDDLAHVNAPGSRHAVRWQDVDELLDAGISVIGTLNITHLDSLADVVSEIIGLAEPDTIPDTWVRAADQVELVDMTPEALRRRIAHGNVLAPGAADAALANLFRPGNLAALRELALLWVADRVDEFLTRYRTERGITVPWEARERVVVGITGGPGGADVIRRAARLAERQRGDLLAVHILAGDAIPVDAVAMAEQRALVESLGGSWHEVVGDDVATTLVEFARIENASQLVVGATRRSRWARLTQGDVIGEVLGRAGPIDVHIVTSPDSPGRPSRTRLPRRRGAAALPWRRVLAGWLLAVGGLVAVTALLVSLHPGIGFAGDAFAYLLLVVAVATVGGFGPAAFTSALSFLSLLWFFVPPERSLAISDVPVGLALVAFGVVAVVVSRLLSVATRRRLAAERAAGAAESLAAMSGAVLRGDDPLPDLLARVQRTFALDGATVVERRTDGDAVVVAAAGNAAPRSERGARDVVEIDERRALLLAGRPLGVEDRRMLDAFAAQLAVALESRRLGAEAARAASLEEADRLRSALLDAVSHDLRTPLASIKMSVTTMLALGDDLPAEAGTELLRGVDEQADRLNRLVGNLLDMSRIHTGTMTVLSAPVGLDEVVAAALASLTATGDVHFDVDVAETLPAVDVDAALLERAVANLAANAAAHAGDDRSVRIYANAVGGRVELRISDRGPGIRPEDRARVLQPFQRLGDAPRGSGVGLGMAVANGFVQILGGELELDDTPGGGLTVTISFPAATT